jgi:hypothetical protein
VNVQDNTPVSLRIALSASELHIAWPETCTRYTLEGKAILDSSIDWTPIGDGQPVNASYLITVPVDSDVKFFRLRAH